MLDTEEVATAYLFDWGKPLSVKGVSGLGVLRGQSSLEVDGEILYFKKTILGLASLLKDVTYGDELIHDGDTYQVVHDPFESADTGFCRVPVLGPITVTPTGPFFPIQLTTTTGQWLVTTTGDSIVTAQGVPNG